MKKKFILLLSLVPLISYSATVSETLFLNAGMFITVDTLSAPYIAFNRTNVFDARNAVISLAAGDDLDATVINTDTLPHGFAVRGLYAGTVIPAGDTLVVTINFPAQGVFIYYDHLDFPKNTYLGAAGMICAESPNSATGKFYWNFREHQLAWNDSLANNQTVDWTTYKPDYFTINGLSKPDLQNDSTAVIRGNVGETLRIFMINPGLSVHPVHFHGYHARILYSSKDSRQVNWEKDTFPLWPMEGFIVELIPDKPGLFPVHDHNLFSQTGGMVYNNGMFIMMEIN
jgi:FtsP/CotA-like multicopper oxidase with cupredoxin domain